MKTRRVLSGAVALLLIFFVLGLTPLESLSALPADTTPPTIVFQTPIDGATVQPNPYGMVYVRAMASDTGGIRWVSLSVPHSHATMWPTGRPKWALIQVGWHTNDDAPGTYPATCVAVDRAGNRSEKTIWMKLP